MRIGVDLGGTKIEAIAIDESGNELWRRRVIFPNADLRDQIDLLLNFHPAAIRALWVDR